MIHDFFQSGTTVALISRMDIPRSTYRLQFNKSFTFSDAREVIPYLSELGISHVYASPIFAARKGSLHGYDIADPNKINEEIGGYVGFEALSEVVKQYNMGWIQDIVPNHMAFDSANKLLMELLENGPDALPLQYFDIEWNHQYEAIRGKLLAPLLGAPYSDCLERGEIRIKYDKDGFSLNYYDNRFPLRMETYSTVLGYGLEKRKSQSGYPEKGLVKLLGVLYAIKNLPAAQKTESRKAQVTFTKEILWELYESDELIRALVDETVAEYNGEPGKPGTFALLDALHGEQLFKLSYWKVATEELNYRRFFTVNDLISVRVEDEEVFRKTHELIFELINQGRFGGLRVDHIDGLYDPQTYLERLRMVTPETYIIVEKILGYDEGLPTVWPIQGTTGYDFLTHVNELFCDKRHLRQFERIYSNFTGVKAIYELLLFEKKKLIISKHMVGDIDNLALLIKKISGHDRRGSDITLYGLRRALVNLLAFFPVYRSYINGKMFSAEDHAHLQRAIMDAKRADPGFEREFAFIERFFLLQFDPSVSDEKKRDWMNVVMRFQQFTGPLMAKGFEDTFLYVYNRLISLNDVGGRPNIFGITHEVFHHFNIKRGKNWPNTMNTTSTHDTKRGEDTRARINVLSEIPEEWEFRIRKWSKINQEKRIYAGREIPDSNDEYFFYQTMIGAYPLSESEHESFVERMCAYMLKAVKEAEVHTAWIKSDIDYERGITLFVKKVLERKPSSEFLDDFIPFQRKVAWYGLFNSLSQCLLKITAPGVADFYQGTELWDFSLVDPDNRNQVDFKKRKAFLDTIIKQKDSEYDRFIQYLFENWVDGRIKMFLIYRGLKARNENVELFQNGYYIPLTVTGIYKENIVAYLRKNELGYILVAVPRLIVSIVDENQFPTGKTVWKDTEILIPENVPGRWIDLITGHSIIAHSSINVGDLLELFPAALLIG